MSKKKKDLEGTIKEKISPLLEGIMEKSFGVTIPNIEVNITDKLKNPQLDVYIPLDLNFSDAKKKFKKEFFKRELKLNKGNISRLAKLLGIDRRSVHRTIKNLDINMESIKDSGMSKEEYREDFIGKTIRSTLNEYKEIIQPQKMEKMYEEVSSLSRNIAKFLPLEEISWKEAEQEFERQFLSNALKRNDWKISKTARDVELRAETLHRKVKKLRLRKKS